MTRTQPLLLTALLLLPGLAFAQAYGPRDEGRRFDDGSRVVCRNVEVQRNSNDPNRIAGTATGAVIGGLIGRNVQGNRQEARGDRIVERQCERVWR